MNISSFAARFFFRSFESCASSKCDHIPSKEIIKRTIFNLRTLLDDSTGRSEEAAFVCVRLVDLLRREWAGGKGAKTSHRHSSGSSGEVGFCFPVEDLTSLVSELCSSYSYLIWENLRLKVPSKPLNTFIRDRSESAISLEDASVGSESTANLNNDPTLVAIASGLSVDCDLLDWTCWDKAFGENLAFSLRQEGEAVLSRLDDLGLSDHATTAMLKKMNTLANSELYKWQEMEDNVRDKVAVLRAKNEKRLNGWCGQEILKGSRARQRWQGILEEMASERGPWGKIKEVRSGVERSDELRQRVHGILSLNVNADTSVRNVALSTLPRFLTL